MNCQFDLKIANLKSTIAKENNGTYYEDYDYTDTNLDAVFKEYSSGINEKSRLKFNYIQENMPKSQEMESIVCDILKFYEDYFMTYTFEKTFKIEIRFFLHVKFRCMDGDSVGNYIRVSCKNLAESASYENGEDFKNHLRRVLAHEIYHLLHFNHCRSIGKKHSADICEEILNEVFANYFCYEYMLNFLERTEGKDTVGYNQKRNSIFNWYQDIKYFGIGRKHLFPKVYSAEEIEKDGEQLEKLLEGNETGRIVDTSQYPVSSAEYAAGYYLSFYEKKYKETDRKLYTKMYRQYLTGDAAAALAELIQRKEKDI